MMSDEIAEAWQQLRRELDKEALEASDGRYAPHNHRPDKKFRCSLCPGCAAEMGVPSGYQMSDKNRAAQSYCGTDPSLWPR